MSQRILLVEDNPITRKLVRYALEAERYVVLEAVDGTSGLRMFADEPVSLVLLDLVLPDGDGFSFLERFRRLPRGREVPMLAFSGMLSQHDGARISAVGFDDVVSKPIEPSRLVQIVRAYLPQVAPAPASREERRTLVIADDDPVQRKLVTMRLQRAGYDVKAAADGMEALALVRQHRPHAIVSDVLMPRLDGFGLCVAVREDPALANTPVLLVSNSYLESEDHALARRVGADDLILRTPELHEVIATLQSDRLTARMSGHVPATTTIDPSVERERVMRMMNQLDRQVAMQASLSQRGSLLSAELSVLSGISEALTRSHDIEDALHEVLATCFDAGGISIGVLYLRREDGLHGMPFGALERTSPGDIATFFGHLDELTALIDRQTFLSVVDPVLLAATQATSMLIAPLGYRGEPLGAMVTMSQTLDLQTPDRIAFAQAVAGQISVALALARSFQAKDASEREARSTATLLRSILESMADGVVVSDEQGMLTHVNPAGHDLLRAVDHPEFPLRRALRGEAIDRAELFVQDNGDRDHGRWLSVNARPLVDDQPGARRAVAVLRDVTAEKAAQSQLLVSDRMAALGMLAAGVGHEINNPLMAVLGNLEMAVEDLDALVATHGTKIQFGDLPDALRDAYDAASRVRNIVRDLKLFSRADEETATEIDVSTVLESSIRLVGNEIRHRARLVRDLQPTPSVTVNESRLGQVFVNLIVNAVQALPEGRADANEIRVATSVAADGRVSVQIRDTGTGMPPEVVARIFTPFFTTKPVGVGTGLGLAICHQLVASAGGEIRVDTAVGKGSTFEVLLPPAVAVAAVRRGSAVTTPPARARGRVLVIDDEAIVGAMIRRALGAEHDVTAMTDAREALREIAAGARFDAILCDLMMPNATGMELHAELVALAPEQARKMVFITGGAFTADARAFLEEVTNRRLEKPIELAALREVIAETIRGEVR